VIIRSPHGFVRTPYASRPVMEFSMTELEGRGSPIILSEPDDGTINAHCLLVKWLFVCTATIGLPFAALVLYFDASGRGRLTVGIAVIAAGAGGGFVSSLRRLYGFQDMFPRPGYTRLFQEMNLYVIAYSLVPSVVGTIGAIIVYLVFAGGLLTGGLFPKFHCSQQDMCTDFHGFVAYWMPVDSADNAKAIVWGFIAGFSERFVPDILNRFEGKSGRNGRAERDAP
jgi:hypothetical protein